MCTTKLIFPRIYRKNRNVISNVRQTVAQLSSWRCADERLPASGGELESCSTKQKEFVPVQERAK